MPNVETTVTGSMETEMTGTGVTGTDMTDTDVTGADIIITNKNNNVNKFINTR